MRPSSAETPQIASVRYADDAGTWQSCPRRLAGLTGRLAGLTRRLAGLRRRLRGLVVIALYLVPAAATLAFSGVVAHALGLAVGGALVMLATPVVGFTRNQMTLTSRGSRLAATVADVLALKRSDAAAFAQLLAIIFRRRPAAVYGIHSSMLQGIRKDQLLSDVPLEIIRGDDSTDGTIPVRDVGGRASCRKQYRIQPAHDRVHWRRDRFSRGERMCARERGIRSFWQSLLPAERETLLTVATADFTVFLQHHPHLLGILERQLYGRLDSQPAFSASDNAGRPSWSGQNCSIFMVDIAAFSGRGRTDQDRGAVRDAMYAILRDAFANSAVPWQECHREDRGDGVLIIVPPSIPTSSVADPLLARLSSALKQYNHGAAEATRIQLRVALHVGPVVSDTWGVSGEAIILTARTLDAPVLKKELARAQANLGIIVSPFVYDSVIKHGPGYVDPARYRHVRLRVKESSLSAWMCLAV
jgi:hypothetical protein